MEWPRNDFNPFWRILILDYGIDSHIDLPNYKIIFFAKDSDFRMDLRDFKSVIDSIVYKSSKNPFIKFAKKDSYEHFFTCLSHESGAHGKYIEWIEGYLLPKMTPVLNLKIVTKEEHNKTRNSAYKYLIL